MGKFTQSVYNVGNNGPDVEIKALSVTQNGTYSETGKAYSPVIVAVDSDQWKKVESGTLTIASGDTSTTAAYLKTTNVKPTKPCLYLLHTKKANQDVNTLSEEWSMVYVYKSSQSATGVSITTAQNLIKRNGSPITNYNMTSSSSVGMYLYGSLSDGAFQIYKKYNSSSTPNWSGDYNYEIYECDLDVFSPAT